MSIAFRPLKRAALQAFQRTGGFNLVADSDWRRQRLLILCYHGISLADEHLWNGALYMPPELFEQRLQLLRAMRCNVLPLAEGVERLYAGTLPDRSVVVTFDDGYFDFAAAAHPLLKQYEIPATVYLPTLHCGDGAPTFPLCTSYMLWKARGRSRVEIPEIEANALDLRSEPERQKAFRAVTSMVKRNKVPHREQQELLRRLAGRLHVDFDAILAQRLLQLMDPADATRVAHEGVDIQLHTHRHRTPHDRLKFIDEIEANRERIAALTGRDPRHFCYPSGAYEPEFLPWLAETGVVSATTCDPGLASRRTPPLMLPRLIDTCTTSASEFQGWLSGAAWLITPRRSYAHAEHAV